MVRLVINNHHALPHPWHLHGNNCLIAINTFSIQLLTITMQLQNPIVVLGHSFWVLGAGAAGAGAYVPSRDESKLTTNGVRRDTTFTLGNSWAVITYEADNPGTWFFHCHINWVYSIIIVR